MGNACNALIRKKFSGTWRRRHGISAANPAETSGKRFRFEQLPVANHRPIHGGAHKHLIFVAIVANHAPAPDVSALIATCTQGVLPRMRRSGLHPRLGCHGVGRVGRPTHCVHSLFAGAPMGAMPYRESPIAPMGRSYRNIARAGWRRPPAHGHPGVGRVGPTYVGLSLFAGAHPARSYKALGLRTSNSPSSSRPSDRVNDTTTLLPTFSGALGRINIRCMPPGLSTAVASGAMRSSGR